MSADPSVARIQRAWHSSARQALHPAVETYLQEHSGVTIPRAAQLVLARLREHGPLLISDLATACGVDVSTMSRTLRTLGEAGLISRNAGSDLRSVCISLTPEGDRAIAHLLLSAQQLLGEALADWSRADRDQLADLLTRLSDDLAGRLATIPQPARSRRVMLR